MVFQNRPECGARIFKLDRRVCGVTVKQRGKQKAGQPCVSANGMCLPAHWIHSSQCAHSFLPLTADVSQQRWGYRCVPHLTLKMCTSCPAPEWCNSTVSSSLSVPIATSCSAMFYLLYPLSAVRMCTGPSTGAGVASHGPHP